MLDYGISACMETTQDDSGVQTKHYHFGTDPEIAQAFWMQTVMRVSPQITRDINLTEATISMNRKKVFSQEVKNQAVQEA